MAQYALWSPGRSTLPVGRVVVGVRRRFVALETRRAGAGRDPRGLTAVVELELTWRTGVVEQPGVELEAPLATSTAAPSLLVVVAVPLLSRLSDLLNSFFAFVRQKPPQMRTVDLAEVVERARKSARPNLEGIDFMADIEATEPVLLDPDQIQQVLLNLILNAAHSMQTTKKRTLRVRASPGRKLSIHVIDSGCGIAPEHLGKVVDPFYTTKSTGTGLGLAICQRILSAHGGRLSVQSAPAQGTHVPLTLPLYQPPTQDRP